MILYDKEPEGVVTVRFSDPEAARTCARVSVPAVVHRTEIISSYGFR